MSNKFCKFYVSKTRQLLPTIEVKLTTSYLGIQLVPADITDCSKCSIDTHLHSSLTIVVASIVPIAGTTKLKLPIIKTTWRWCWTRSWTRSCYIQPCVVENVLSEKALSYLLSQVLAGISSAYFGSIVLPLFC